MNRTSNSTFKSKSPSGATLVRPLAEGTNMASQDRVEQLVKTIDRAIAQAEELGMAHAVYILRVARLEADLSEIAVETKHPVGVKSI
jgi:hypothetical protein